MQQLSCLMNCDIGVALCFSLDQDLVGFQKSISVLSLNYRQASGVLECVGEDMSWEKMGQGLLKYVSILLVFVLFFCLPFLPSPVCVFCCCVWFFLSEVKSSIMYFAIYIMFIILMKTSSSNRFSFYF